jgi:NAD(P)H-hydrate epimerase
VIPVLSREEARSLDARAIARGVPSLLLMENAGRGAVDVIERVWAAERPGGLRGARVVVVCGTGNNGGDGLVVARRLLVRGALPVAFVVGEEARLTPDARVNRDAFLASGGECSLVTDAEQLPELARALGRAELAIDALFGTGLDRAIAGLSSRVVEALNASPGFRVALDLPSGLDANRGTVLGAAAEVELTVTFACPKRGLLTPGGARLAGRLHVVDIGVPNDFEEPPQAELFDEAEARRVLVRRSPDFHKGRAGRVVIAAGSPGKTGAARLAARGALRSGAGLVSVVTGAVAAPALAPMMLEEMLVIADAHEATAAFQELTPDALVVGPGLGLDERAHAVFIAALSHDVPKVLDADALTLLAEDLGVLARARGPIVLTPHPGELARLLGSSAAEVEADRFAALAEAVSRTKSVVLLKGPHTLIGAPAFPISINDTGSAVLAVGGAGDVLSGVLGALLVHQAPRDAARLAAFIHGSAAEYWARVTAPAPARPSPRERGLLAHELADALPSVFAEVAAPAALSRWHE